MSSEFGRGLAVDTEEGSMEVARAREATGGRNRLK